MAKRRVNPKSLSILMMFALVVVGIFLWLSKREVPKEDNITISAVDEVILKDLDKNYPATPKEVVKLYSEITRCFYGEEYEEEDLIKMAGQSRKLFDDELKANQTEEQYLMNLQSVISNYKEQERIISSFSVSSSVDVDYQEMDGYQWSRLVCIYNIKTGHNLGTTREEYLLRKDDVGHWKIYGWRVIDEGQNG